TLQEHHKYPFYDDLDSVQTVQWHTRSSFPHHPRPQLCRQATSSSRLPHFIGQTPHPGKMLIVCFDGTGNDFNADNSNVVQLVSMLKRDDKMQQMVYYQAGIGTYISPSAPVISHIASKAYKILDEMLAL
ncbi:hypothetical protein AX14_007872, partial [Amanita brunnescens Koide BX004]